MKTRIFTKRGSTFVTFIVASLLPQACSNRPEIPNIILINADDLGWMDLAIYGSEYYETPNIDRIASEGMLFTDAYAAAANSAPSRACLITGFNTPRHGIYTVSSSERGDARFRRLIPTENTQILDTSFVTIAEELKQEGFVTASIGKWHVGYDPCHYGFDINIGGNTQGHPVSYFSPYKNKDLPDGHIKEYLTDRLTTEAIKFIEDNKREKFFLYLPYYAVHSPLQAKEEIISKYNAKEKTPGQGNAVYAAMIETMDRNIGRIMEYLEKEGLTGKTLLIFTSDNGGVRATSSQHPLRGGKGSYYEGGIRVPLIIKWPGIVDRGSLCHVPVTNIDFYATLLNAAGITKPLNNKTDGLSLIPLLTGSGNFDSERPLVWHFPVYLEAYSRILDDGRDPLFRTRPGSVVRAGRWKLHEYFEDQGFELYDLENDPGERNNVADANPEKMEELKKYLVSWRTSMNAPVPTDLNPDYDPESAKRASEGK